MQLEDRINREYYSQDQAAYKLTSVVILSMNREEDLKKT